MIYEWLDIVDLGQAEYRVGIGPFGKQEELIDKFDSSGGSYEEYLEGEELTTQTMSAYGIWG